MWVDCSNPDDLTCISRKDHLFCISFSSINLLKSVLPFEVALILLSMTRSSIWSALLSISLYSLPSRNIEQSISFRAETPFEGYFLTASAISRSHLGYTREQES